MVVLRPALVRGESLRSRRVTVSLTASVISWTSLVGGADLGMAGRACLGALGGGGGGERCCAGAEGSRKGSEWGWTAAISFQERPCACLGPFPRQAGSAPVSGARCAAALCGIFRVGAGSGQPGARGGGGEKGQRGPDGDQPHAELFLLRG